MVRRSAFQSRTRLSVTQLEDRVVPAGMIEVLEGVDFAGTQTLHIIGDNNANHIRVSPSGGDMVVTSTTGPIKYTPLNGPSTTTSGPLVLPAHTWSGLATRLFVHGLNGDDNIEVIGDVWAEIQIASDAGNDRVFLDALTNKCGIGTGGGSDVVEIRNSQVRYFNVDTGLQNDRVLIAGTNSFYVLDLSLGGGADVLEGDTTPGAGLLPLSRVEGGAAHAHSEPVRWRWEGQTVECGLLPAARCSSQH